MKELCEDTSARTGILEEEVRELRQALLTCQEQVDAMAKMANKDLNLVANVGHADKTCPSDAMVDGSRDAVAPSKAGGSMRAAIRAMPRRHMIRRPYDLALALCTNFALCVLEGILP